MIVTNNLFGDIITDLGATFQGGLGMAASGNIHPGRTSMFEPVHGSAPKFAGKNIANPIGAIASAALMLETLGLTEEAAAIDAAVLQAVRERSGDAGCRRNAGDERSGGFHRGGSSSAEDSARRFSREVHDRHEGHDVTFDELAIVA